MRKDEDSFFVQAEEGIRDARETGRLDCNQPPTDTNFLLPSGALRNLCANRSAVCRPIAPADDIHYVAPGVLSSVTQ